MPLTVAQSNYYEHQVLLAAAGGLAWLTYDTVIHWDKEAECIWWRSRAWVKSAYFVMRYLPILHEGAILTLIRGLTFSKSGCRGWIYYELIFAQVLTLVVEIILVIRLYVLYSRNKIILALIIFALVAEVTVMAVMLGVTLPKLTYRPDCIILSSPGIFVGFWLSPLVFETFLFVLTLIKFYQSVASELGRHSVLYIFVRDGIWAFALIFVVMLLNLLMYKLAQTPYVGVCYTWALSIMSFSGSHILLNLRSLGLDHGSFDAATTTVPFSYSRSGSSRDWRFEITTRWKTYFTTAIDIDIDVEDQPHETIELQSVDQIVDFTALART